MTDTTPTAEAEAPAPNLYQRVILAALNNLGKHVYQGAEAPGERAARRRIDKRTRGLAQARTRRGRRLMAQADAATDRAIRRLKARGVEVDPVAEEVAA